MKKFSCFIAICCCAFGELFDRVFADSPAIVSVDHAEDLRIINKTNNSEYGRFRASVFSNPQKCADGSLKFSLRVDLGNFNEEVRFENKTIKDSVNGKVFYVVIPKNELKNDTFSKEIWLKSDNKDFWLDMIKLKIEPKVEISADQKQVNFGKIFHNGGLLTSSNSPSVSLRYSVLKDAVCEVTSQNNFRLKNKDKYIPYSVSGITNNREISLPSDKNECVVNFKISGYGKKTSAGTYSDRITFSIKTRI